MARANAELKRIQSGTSFLECPEFEAQRIVLRDIVPHNEWKLPEAIKFLVSNAEAFQTLIDFSKETLWIKQPQKED